MTDNYEKPLNSDGSKNPKYVDLLEEDKPLAGQKFGCVSFVSPENVLKLKNLFFFEQFLKKWEVSKSMEKFTQFLNYISYKYDVDFDKMMGDLEEFSKEEKKTINHSTLSDDYKNFLDQYEDDLEKVSGLEHQIIAAKPRSAIESYQTEEDFYLANPPETPLEPDNPEATEEISKSASKDAVREVLILILVGIVTLAIAIGLGIYFR